MTNDYGTGTYRNNTFKMNLTEAIRAHANHELPEAVKHYHAAIGGANNGRARLLHPLLFLKSQADSSTGGWQLREAITHAYKSGFSGELEDISNLIEDQTVRAVYNHYLAGTKEGTLAATRKIPRSAFIDPTPTGRTKRPQ